MARNDGSRWSASRGCTRCPTGAGWRACRVPVPPAGFCVSPWTRTATRESAFPGAVGDALATSTGWCWRRSSARARRGMEACHDPDPSHANNRLTNLRWDTHAANQHDLARLTPNSSRLRDRAVWAKWKAMTPDQRREWVAENWRRAHGDEPMPGARSLGTCLISGRLACGPCSGRLGGLPGGGSLTGSQRGSSSLISDCPTGFPQVP